MKGPLSAWRSFLGVILLVMLLAGQPFGRSSQALAQTTGSSLRFYGSGVRARDLDRVKIPLDNPQAPVDVGNDFTIEFWMKALPGENSSGSCSNAAYGDAWITGNIMIDRDVYNSGDHGDYGIALFAGNGRLAFGVDRGGSGNTLCGGSNLANGQWHHIAVTRNSSTSSAAGERLQLFVDGVRVAASNGPAGDISYRNGRTTSYPGSDPYLVLGAEKHDAGAAYPSFSGWLDDMRVSNIVRYGASGYSVPSGPLPADGNTVALYRFDENSGTTIRDELGQSNGILRYGGNPAGPVWSSDTPLNGGAPTATATPTTLPTSTPTATPTRTSLPASTSTATPTRTPLPANTPTATPSSTPIPTSAPTVTATPSATSAPFTGNLLANSGFELDANGDGQPDSWSSTSAFTRSTPAQSGSYSGRHSATNNSSYTVSQTAANITPGRTYTLGAHVNIPPTSDSFAFELRVQWLNNNGAIRTDSLGSISSATNGWASGTATLVAPAGATNAQVQMVVTSLNATIYIDNLAFNAL